MDRDILKEEWEIIVLIHHHDTLCFFIFNYKRNLEKCQLAPESPSTECLELVNHDADPDNPLSLRRV